MGEKKSLEVNDFFAELRYLTQEVIILRAIRLHFLLKIRQPLLLALTALQCGDPALLLGMDVRYIEGDSSNVPITLKEILPFLFIGHLNL